MSEKKEYNRIFYIVFINIRQNRWWKRFVDKEINHCYAITDCGNDRAIMINQAEGGIEINTYHSNACDLATDIAGRNKNIVKAVVKQEDIVKLRFRFLRNCVGLCMDLIGFKKHFVFTPKQFYNSLKEDLWEVS